MKEKVTLTIPQVPKLGQVINVPSFVDEVVLPKEQTITLPSYHEMKYATISFSDQPELEVTDVSVKCDTDFVPHPASSIHTPVDFSKCVSGFISIPCDDETFDEVSEIKRQLSEIFLYNFVNNTTDHAWLSVFDR